MAVSGDEKQKFRCLDAGRYAVAFMVAVLVVVVIVHAVVTVLRPGDLIVRLDGGHVFANVTSATSTFSIKFTLEALNPSGRVRIYFTSIQANISRSLTAEDFVIVGVQDFDVGQQDSAAVITRLNDSPKAGMSPDAFDQLGRGDTIGNAILKLSGIRTVETYAGHKKPGKRVLYYCSSITVAAEEPEDAPPYVPCTEQQLPASGSTYISNPL